MSDQHSAREIEPDRRSSLLTPIAIVTGAWLAKKVLNSAKNRVTQPAVIAAGVISTSRKTRNFFRNRVQSNTIPTQEAALAVAAARDEPGPLNIKNLENPTLLVSMAVGVAQIVLNKVLENRNYRQS